MDLIAERGIASHYSGKVFVNGSVGNVMPNGSRAKTICLNNANVALWGMARGVCWEYELQEFVDIVTRDLLDSRIFVSTPRGEIKNPPVEATVIDYAYMFRVEIGNKMVAAKYTQ